MDYFNYILEKERKLNKIIQEIKKSFYETGYKIGKEIEEKYKNDPKFREIINAMIKKEEKEKK